MNLALPIYLILFCVSFSIALFGFSKNEWSVGKAFLIFSAPVWITIAASTLFVVLVHVRMFFAKLKFNQQFFKAGKDDAEPDAWVPGIVGFCFSEDQRHERLALVTDVTLALAKNLENDLKTQRLSHHGPAICNRAHAILDLGSQYDYARERGLTPDGKPAIVQDAFHALVCARSMSNFGCRPGDIFWPGTISLNRIMHGHHPFPK